MKEFKNIIKIIDKIGGCIYEPIDNKENTTWIDNVLAQAKEDYGNKMKILHKKEIIEIVEG